VTLGLFYQGLRVFGLDRRHGIKNGHVHLSHLWY
jgi:hypothetical protein